MAQIFFNYRNLIVIQIFSKSSSFTSIPILSSLSIAVVIFVVGDSPPQDSPGPQGSAVIQVYLYLNAQFFKTVR
jgi:hypothetical protein